MGKLSVKKIRELNKPGRYADGDGLYYHIRQGGSKQWLLRISFEGKRRDIGIGSANIFTLADARENAVELRKNIKSGENPLALKQKQKSIPAFAEAAQRVWEQKKPHWKNEKHANQWINTLATYAFPKIGELKVNSIGSADILRVLEPIWLSKAETADRVLQRLSAVFDWAKTAGHRTDENPTNGIRNRLAKRKREKKHHAALHWKKLPEFMHQLGMRSGISALALMFIILTATRSGETRDARWKEIDFETKTWVIPAERMKMRKAHRIPLSDQAIEILKECVGLDKELVFPSNRACKPLSDMVFKALFKRMGYADLTAHGFRSTFRDCCSEKLDASWELAELSLAHNVGNATERAYARSDQLEKRRGLMQEWADFATQLPDEK